ncbi:MAG: GNAT family N-acetyltransferase [Gemmatimonadaceae bacterium]|nr:GNAT family N-acetyltransferase [Gloeobacterales cyanobacterium ES-bin-141]
MNFVVMPVGWDEYRQELNAVRRVVFIEEQRVPEHLETDAWDGRSLHVLACDLAQNPIGCGRLLPDGHLGRMAVLNAWRGQGVGRAILARLLGLARESGMNNIEISAQVHALEFYRKAGFKVYGDVYEEAGIPHCTMHLWLGLRRGSSL